MRGHIGMKLRGCFCVLDRFLALSWQYLPKPRWIAAMHAMDYRRLRDRQRERRQTNHDLAQEVGLLACGIPKFETPFARIKRVEWLLRPQVPRARP